MTAKFLTDTTSTGPQWWKFANATDPNSPTYLPSNTSWYTNWNSPVAELRTPARTQLYQTLQSDPNFAAAVAAGLKLTGPNATRLSDQKWVTANAGKIANWLGTIPMVSGTMSDLMGYTGEQGQVKPTDTADWNKWVTTLKSTDPFYGNFYQNLGSTTFTPEQWNTAVSGFNTYKTQQADLKDQTDAATQYGVPVSDLVKASDLPAGPGGAPRQGYPTNYIPDPSKYEQDAKGKWITHDFAASLTNEEAAQLWNQTLPNQTQSLDQIYAGKEYLAARDFNAWLDSPYNPADKDSPTNRAYYSSNGRALPQFDVQGNITGGTNVNEAQAKEMMQKFIQWKPGNDARKAAATTLGVDASTLVQDASGNWIKDPAKTAATIAPGTLDAQGNPTGSVWNNLRDTLGTSNVDTIFQQLLSGVKTDAQINEAFKNFWAPSETMWNEYTKPEAAAQTQENLGEAFGSGTGAGATKAAAVYQSQKSAAFQTYYDAQQQHNINALEEIRNYSNDVYDTAQKIASTGMTLATTQQIQSNVRIAESQAWDTLATNDTNRRYIDAMVDKLRTDNEGAKIENLWKGYQIAVGEMGFDANILTTLAEQYYTQYEGSLGDPLTSLYLALSDMQQLTGYQTGVGPGWGLVGSGITAAGSILGGSNKTTTSSTAGKAQGTHIP